MASEAQPAKVRAGKMLFVSRLPYSVTTDTLNEYFGDIGPLRKAFVVTDKESKQSKGVAYVQYALADDAERALSELGNKPIPGVEGAARPIRIELARTREPPAEGRKRPAETSDAGAKKPRIEAPPPVKREVKAEPKGEDFQQAIKAQKTVPPLGPRQNAAVGEGGSTSKPHVSKDDRALAQRTLVVSGLARCSPLSDTKQLYKRTRKLGDVEEVLYPAPGTKGNDVAHVVFRTPNHAHLAAPKFDGHVYKSATLRAHLKARLDARSRLEKTITNPETQARREAAAEKVKACSLLKAINGLKLPYSSRRVPGQGPLDGMELLSHASGGAFANGKIERRNRLIVRNLPFDITKEDLKAYFLPFGPLYEVDIPQIEKTVRARKHTRRKKQGVESEKSDAEEESDDGSPVSDDASQESEEETDSRNDESQQEDGLGEDAPADVRVKSEPESDSDEILVKSERESDPGDVKVKSESESSDVKQEPDDSLAVPESKSQPDQPGRLLMRGRGFAFVWFVSYGDAERALSLSETEMQHGHAEHVALDAAKNSGLGVVRRKAKKARDAVLQHPHPARKVSVQLALAKDEFERAKPDEAPDADASEEEQEEKEEGEKSRPPPPEAGTTLFVRNVPFSASETEFAALFRHFGPMRYARLVLGSDKSPRGTGFVSFWDKDHADACLALARRLAKEAAASEQGENQKQKDGQHYSSVLTADAGSALTAPLTLQGRVLVVVPAMERTDAAAIAADRVAARAKTDKRNTHLLREGVPFAHSILASEVGEKDAEARLQSFGLRKQQLSANAALYVSPTRLSVRRLPLWVGDVELRKLSQLALRKFDEEVKTGSRPALAPAEAEAAGFDPGSVTTKGVHARVIRQKDRLDWLFASRGLGRSQGFGFVELPSLPHALKLLRYLNAWRDGVPTLQRLHQAELQGTQKHLRAELKSRTGEQREEKELLLKRIDERLKDLETNQERGGRLLVEFALENATITRRRRERTLQLKAGNERKARDPNATRISHAGERQWGKLEAKADAQIKGAKKQRGVGGVIARKRQEKKAKHKGAKAKA